MRVPLMLLTLLCTTVLALPASHADDDPTPVEPKKAAPVRLPPFTLKDIEPAADTFPVAWSAAGGETQIPETAPTVSRLLALARAAGVDAQKIDARCLPMRGKEGATGVAGWVTLDAAPEAFSKALAASATKHGWTVRELGSPTRVAVAWGSTDEAAATIVDWEAEIAVRRLCDSSFGVIAGAQDRAAFDRGRLLLGAAQRIEAQAAPVYYMQGRILSMIGRANEALTAFRAALARGVKYPLTDRWKVIAAFHAGQGLLTAGSAELLDEAVATLKAGVAAEAASEEHFMRFGNRYNLACAYARQDKKDAAFKELDESLRYLKKAWKEDKAKSFSGESSIDYPAHYKHALEVDTDLAPLRDDERWAALMAKHDPDAKAPAKDAEKKVPGK